MRIVHLITARQLRGAEVFAAQLAGQQRCDGHDVIMAALYKTSFEPLSGDVDVIELEGSKKTIDTVLLRRVGRFLRASRPDVIQANGADTLKYSVLAKMMGYTTAPIVYRNISVASAWLKGFLQHQVYRYLFGKVSCVAGVSHRSAEDFQRTYGYPRSKIRVIPIGAFPQVPETDDLRKEFARLFPEQGSVLIHIGSVTPEKNHEGLLRIFQLARRSNPELKLLMIGDGPLRADVQNRIASEGIADVKFIGFRPDARQFLNFATLLVLPSLIEGIPGVVLEACAYGVPAVCYDVGAIHEVVVSGKSGFLVHKGDEQAFADCVTRFIQDRAMLNDFGKAARQIFEKEYQFDKIARQFMAMYESVVEKR